MQCMVNNLKNIQRVNCAAQVDEDYMNLNQQYYGCRAVMAWAAGCVWQFYNYKEIGNNKQILGCDPKIDYCNHEDPNKKVEKKNINCNPEKDPKCFGPKCDPTDSTCAHKHYDQNNELNPKITPLNPVDKNGDSKCNKVRTCSSILVTPTIGGPTYGGSLCDYTSIDCQGTGNDCYTQKCVSGGIGVATGILAGSGTGSYCSTTHYDCKTFEPIGPSICGFQFCVGTSIGEGTVGVTDTCYNVDCTKNGPVCESEHCVGVGGGANVPGVSGDMSMVLCGTLSLSCVPGTGFLCEKGCGNNGLQLYGR